jgi:hypothetical protein
MEKCKMFGGVRSDVEKDYNKFLETNPTIKSEMMQATQYGYSEDDGARVTDIWVTFMVRYEEYSKEQFTGPR